MLVAQPGAPPKKGEEPWSNGVNRRCSARFHARLFSFFCSSSPPPHLSCFLFSSSSSFFFVLTCLAQAKVNQHGHNLAVHNVDQNVARVRVGVEKAIGKNLRAGAKKEKRIRKRKKKKKERKGRKNQVELTRTCSAYACEMRVSMASRSIPAASSASKSVT